MARARAIKDPQDSSLINRLNEELQVVSTCTMRLMFHCILNGTDKVRLRFMTLWNLKHVICLCINKKTFLGFHFTVMNLYEIKMKCWSFSLTRHCHSGFDCLSKDSSRMCLKQISCMRCYHRWSDKEVDCSEMTLSRCWCCEPHPGTHEQRKSERGGDQENHHSSCLQSERMRVFEYVNLLFNNNINTPKSNWSDAVHAKRI